jgi:hypothetical protein
VTDPSPAPSDAPSATSGKGRPTPKRQRVAEAAHRAGPAPTEDAQGGRSASPGRGVAQRNAAKKGAAKGEDRYLMKRDAGPVRKLVRDTVDSRRNIGVLILPLAIVLVASSLIGNRAVMDIALALWMGAILALLVDSALTAFLIRRNIRQAFPEEGRTGRHIGYGLLRSTVFRRMRLPKPQVSPGSWR